MADTAALTKSNDSGYIRAKALPQQGVGISFGHLGQAKYQNNRSTLISLDALSVKTGLLYQIFYSNWDAHLMNTRWPPTKSVNI
jgi:hypothetical protein